jgi:serine/threonine-protein kinase
MSQSDEALAPGATFAGYQIVRKLGEGAFGVVYEAVRQTLGKRVALKVLKREAGANDDVHKRFLREAQMTAQLSHPHVVETFDVGTYEGAPYLAMEFLEGEPLSTRLKREGKLPVSLTIEVMLPVFSAMAAVHERGAVHRDLKPDNLFLVRARGSQVVPKVLDFGIAKIRDHDKGMTLTQTSALLGTPYYMSPEQVRESKHVDARSDQWTLGVIFYECITGARPFTGTSLIEVLTRISGGMFTPPAQLCPDAPAPVVAVLERMLRTDPDARFEDMRAVGRALLPHASPATRSRWADDFAAPLASMGDGEAKAQQGPWVQRVSDTQAATPHSTLTLSAKERVTTTPSEAPRRRAHTTAIAAGLVTLVLVTGVGVTLSRRSEPAPPTTRLVSAPAAVAQARFRVHTRVVPESAALTLDREAPVTGSIDRELVRDGATHRLVASAPGYRRMEFEFRDSFASPEIVLVREGPTEPVAVAAPPVAVAPDAEPQPRRRTRTRRRNDEGSPSGGTEIGANGVTIR